MRYIASSYGLRFAGWIGDKPGETDPNLHTDADIGVVSPKPMSEWRNLRKGRTPPTTRREDAQIRWIMDTQVRKNPGFGAALNAV